MRYLTFSNQISPVYPVAVLVPKLESDGIKREYIDPSLLVPEQVIAYELYQTGKKTSANDMRIYLSELLPILGDLKTEYLLVGEGEYFKALTGVSKADPYIGYVLPNTYPALMAGQFQVLYVPNYRQVFYDPAKTRAKISRVLDALWAHQQGSYRDPGDSVIKSAAYPSTVADIAVWLQRLLIKPALACDIEGFSLKHYNAGLGTISFAWNQGEGIAFAVDLGEDPAAIRQLLKKFFRQYRGRLIWHNAGYDVGVKIFQLFMTDLLDTAGLLDGLEVFYDRDWDDTKLITYLATNSCAGNKLSLKEQAQEFAGNYAQEDIKDITKIPLPQLLEYNLIDSLSTWFVYEKYWNQLIADDQLQVYEELFKPALIDITQMQLTGMPLDMEKVAEARKILELAIGDAVSRIQSEPLIREFTYQLRISAEADRRREWEERKAAGIKVRAYVPGKFNEEFNPNSGPQLQKLLFEDLGLPILERTETKQPATGGDVLLKLRAHTEDPQIKALLQALVDHKKVDKILTSFIPAMENAVQGPDGWFYLFGNFNLGGTVSGRLSSCVAAWTRLKTKRGLIPINEIRVGDLVWTHNRRWRQVEDIILKPTTPMVDVHFCSGYVLTCTMDHKLRLPNGSWKTLKEIIYERIQDVDAESHEHFGDAGSISQRPPENHGANRPRFGDQSPEHHPCSGTKPADGGVQSPQSAALLHLKRGGSQPNEGQKGGKTPQLDWGIPGSQGLPDYRARRQETIRASYQDGQGIGSHDLTQSSGCPSYRQQSVEQRVGQSGFGNEGWARNDPLPSSKDGRGKIAAIHHRGSLQVWDITVAEDHSYWAEGCFNHNSDPNLQNLPANSKYAKLIKDCFRAPPGYLIIGLDFSSLEDRISALTTKDPNKLVVYSPTQTYRLTVDGTCHHIAQDTKIRYDGKTYTGEEFYGRFGPHRAL